MSEKGIKDAVATERCGKCGAERVQDNDPALQLAMRQSGITVAEFEEAMHSWFRITPQPPPDHSWVTTEKIGEPSHQDGFWVLAGASAAFFTVAVLLGVFWPPAIITCGAFALGGTVLAGEAATRW